LCFQPLRRFVDADAQDLASKPKHPLTQDKTRVCTARRCSKQDPIGIETLLEKFLNRESVTERTSGTRSAVRYEIRLFPFSHRVIECFLEDSVSVFAIKHINDFCTEELIKQNVCRRMLRHFSCQYQRALKTKSCRGCCRLATVIGLDSTTGNQ